METHDASPRLLAATVWFLMALPVGVAAQEVSSQEERQRDAQPAQQPQATQRLFVSDKLVLNVYTEAERGSTRVATIQTGAVVEALDRTDDFIRVRLHDGREGWVGANYLTADPPAAVRLRELEREQKAASRVGDRKSADEIARLKKQTAALQAQLNELRSTPAPTALAGSAMGAPAASAGMAPQAGGDDSARAAAASRDASGASWVWPFIVLLAAGLGFAAGYQMLASRIRKKYGGLKVY